MLVQECVCLAVCGGVGGVRAAAQRENAPLQQRKAQARGESEAIAAWRGAARGVSQLRAKTTHKWYTLLALSLPPASRRQQSNAPKKNQPHTPVDASSSTNHHQPPHLAVLRDGHAKALAAAVKVAPQEQVAELAVERAFVFVVYVQGFECCGVFFLGGRA